MPFKMPFLKSFSILKASFLNLLSLQLSSCISQTVLIQLAYGTADLIIYRWNDELGFPWVQKKKKKRNENIRLSYYSNVY